MYNDYNYDRDKAKPTPNNTHSEKGEIPKADLNPAAGLSEKTTKFTTVNTLTKIS